ncbi:MAG: helix-turn-helix domain-containing protein [Planctomycetes bacterium]|nr:helix-turn-helix domain-containing protein [Planctomycetota bacterium]
MAQGYYTLKEAAQFLNIHVDELKQMAQKGKIRSFQDRGTLRFRVQDIQELARVRGSTSDPDQVLGDASLPPPRSAATPPSGSKKSPRSPKSPVKQEAAPEVFDFAFDGDNVDVGADVMGPSSGPKSKAPGSKGKKVPSPSPLTTGSDSDVRLVPDGSDVTFSIPKQADLKPADSDVRISPDPVKPKAGVHTPPPGSSPKRPSQLAIGSGAKPKSKLGAASDAIAASPRPAGTPQPMDSGVRLVPMDSDSDVKLLGSGDEVPLGEPGGPVASDSNVRLEKVSLPPADSGEGGMLLTEEINLDEEILKQQSREIDQPSTKVKAKSALKLPTSSPFELSDSDLELPAELKDAGPKTPVKSATGQDSSDFELTAQGAGSEDGSSDFDLVPAADGSILLEGESKDFSLEASDENDEVLNEERAELTSSSSGISLDNPADAGISLEEGSDDFDLSLEVEDTPKPARSQPAEDSDSEFELLGEKTPTPVKSRPADASDSEFELGADSDAPATAEDSEFELNLDGSGEGAGGDSDSEFELTLDDSGNLEILDDDAPQVKSKPKKTSVSSEQDIFDTDFEVPALDSADAAAADSELESSDFDLALDDSDLANEEESGSQVVALDEDDAETVADDDAVVDDIEVEEESSEFTDLDEDVQVEEDADEETETTGRTVTKEKLLPAAPWGVMPVIFMLPCVIIMFLVGILGFELVQTSAGLRPPGPLTKAIATQILDQPVSIVKK